MKYSVGRFRVSKPPIDAQYPIQSSIKNPRLEKPNEDQVQGSDYGGLPNGESTLQLSSLQRYA
jgi:hypothetical protein